MIIAGWRGRIAQALDFVSPHDEIAAVPGGDLPIVENPGGQRLRECALSASLPDAPPKHTGEDFVGRRSPLKYSVC
jgi:hypothetical protein